ncbi:MAG: ATP-dependent DNA helicase RecG [Chlorobi bacterium]|nr:ATP-dependent DNA helicase RecG [Chlorobiota bacterium]
MATKKEKITLQTPLVDIKKIGTSKALALNKELGLSTVEDLLLYAPSRYIDKSNMTSIKEAKERFKQGEQAIVHTKVRLEGIAMIRTKNKGRIIVEAVAVDEEGEKIRLVWFNGASWLVKWLKSLDEAVLYGRIQKVGRNSMGISHPELRKSKGEVDNSIIPVYHIPASLGRKKVTETQLKNWIKYLLEEVEDIEEFLPEFLLKKYGFPTRKEAFKQMHFPEDMSLAKKSKDRFKYEELFLLQTALLIAKKKRVTVEKGYKIEKSGVLIHQFVNEKLPFELTDDQKRVVKEIYRDLQSGHPMKRLLQGDVGSGKTLVALLAILIMVGNGYQCALMAPTEVLANQHYKNFLKYVEGLRKEDGQPVRVQLLTGSVKGKKRKDLLVALREGYIDILIGTHALIEDPIQFKKLGLVVVDEQHRFGVAQRARLLAKSSDEDIIPHLLVMSATPIPRTLALTVYGDLDVSVIKQLPPGRKPVITRHFYENNRLEAYRFVKYQIDQGRQAYIIFPLIEESENFDYANIEEGYERVKNFFGPSYSIAIMHGRMKPADKQKAMDDFASGKAQILVATNVVEVGVDVPNATTIVIESAERFGLSQLHQLRGRVCRSSHQPYCILITGKLGIDSKKRINAMLKTSDGFKLAEIDLELRGPGDLLGVQQSGKDIMRIADLLTDRDTLVNARQDSAFIIAKDPNLNRFPKLQERILKQMGEKLFWQRIA